MSHQSNPMKMSLKSWRSRSRSLPPVNVSALKGHEPVPENSLQAELFSTAQMARYGQKLARSHKLSPDKLPYYLLKRLDDNETVITQNCYDLNAGKKRRLCPPVSGCSTTTT